MKFWIYLLLLLLICKRTPLQAASYPDSTVVDEQPQRVITLPLIDVPFMLRAAEMRASGDKVSFKHYLSGYESPSMNQALAVTQSLHSWNYAVNQNLWDNLLPRDTRRNRILNFVGSNLTSGGIDLLFTYYGVVFSVQWLHEEYHRNGMTIRGISSYDETYNRFNGGFANGSVSRVKDEDMIRWKAEDPAGMIRSFAAGIESEFLLLRGLQKANFFDQASYPNLLLNVLLTKHAMDYVNQFKSAGFDDSIDSMNYHGRQISDRDYVGWDFSAWVYDLHRPDEPYEDRGIHPSGTGIDRAIKASRLTEEERQYLTKMGRRQYLNFVSPFMLAIHRIPLGNDAYFNFATRHYLTSFGDHIMLDLMLKKGAKGLSVGLMTYSNRDKWFPGLEVGIPENNSFKLRGISKFSLAPTLTLWMQPKNQRFDDQQGQFGTRLKLDATYQLGERLSLYLQGETKTKGWVAGNPYLDSNTTVRFGLKTNLGF